MLKCQLLPVQLRLRQALPFNLMLCMESCIPGAGAAAAVTAEIADVAALHGHSICCCIPNGAAL
jgi:hypothetical protein